MSRKTGGIELHGHDGTAAEFVAVLTPLVRLGELGSGRQERSKHASDAEAGDRKQGFLAVLVVAEMALMLLIGASLGEVEPFQETRYVFCDGVLNVRMSPRSGSEITGYLFCGDEVTVDDYSKDGAWVHVTGLPTEYGEGWIAYRYTSAEEVELLEEETLAVVEANGRVAVRAGIAGERVRWTSPGTVLTVLARSGEWALVRGGAMMESYLSYLEEGSHAEA